MVSVIPRALATVIDRPAEVLLDGEGVQHEGGIGPKPTGYQTTNCGAQRQHGRPGNRGDRVGRNQFTVRNNGRDRGGLCRLEKCRETQLKNRQRVNQPHLVRPAHQKKAEYDDRPQQIGDDHDRAAAEPVSQDA